jgi:hypothetical protein
LAGLKRRRKEEKYRRFCLPNEELHGIIDTDGFSGYAITHGLLHNIMPPQNKIICGFFMRFSRLNHPL